MNLRRHLARYVSLGAVLSLLLVSTAWAQGAVLRGFVIDGADGQPLADVHVVLAADDAPVAGTVTNRDGFYTFVGLAPRSYEVVASYVGYVSHQDTLHLHDSRIYTRNIALMPVTTDLDELVVSGAAEEGVTPVSAGLQSIRRADVERIASADVNADLVNYLQSMPAVTTTGDRGGQLYIRGGEPAHNLVLLDGIPVAQPFHLLGYYSIFDADLMHRADVYAGGYPSPFGGYLSSVLDVWTRTGDKQAWQASAAASPFMGNVRVEGPLLRSRLSVLASLRHSLVEHVAAPLTRRPLPFAFGDQFFKVHGVLGPSSHLSLTAFRSYDRGAIGENYDGSLTKEIRWQNTGVGGRYLLLPGSYPIVADIRLFFSKLRMEQGPASVPERTSDVTRFGGEVHLNYFAGRGEIRSGAFLHPSTLSYLLNGMVDNYDTDREFVTEAGIYVEPHFRLGGNVQVAIGLRIHSFPSKGRTYFEPRLKTIWRTEGHVISVAAGMYHQQVAAISDQRDATNVFTAWTATPLGGVPAAQHGVLGYALRLPRGLDLSIEGYARRFSNLYVAKWIPYPNITPELQSVEGYARGLDVRAEVQRGAVTGFVTYGLAAVRYRAGGAGLGHVFGEIISYRPPHDRRHQVSVGIAVTQWGAEWKALWQFGSGLPITRPLGFDEFILLDGFIDPFTATGARRVIYGKPYDDLMPTYHRLDVSVARAFTIGNTTWTLHAAVLNAYDRTNIFYLDLFTGYQVNQLPFIPSLGIKVEV